MVGPGNNIRVNRWVVYFTKRGWKVILAADGDYNNPIKKTNVEQIPLYSLRKTNVFRDKLSHGALPEWDIHTIPITPKLFISSVLNIIVGLIKAVRLLSIIKEYNPDVILIHYMSRETYTFWYVTLFKHFIPTTSIPVVIILWSYHAKISLLLKLEKIMMVNINLIHSNDELRKHYQSIIDIPDNRFVIIPWGIDLSKNYPPTQSERDMLRDKFNIPNERFILFHNRIFGEQYNVKEFIEIVRQCKRHIPNVLFIFIQGKTDIDKYGQEVLNKLLEESLDPYYLFIDRALEYDEMRIMYGVANATITPILYDGLCASIMEAMACGSPLILYPLSNYCEYLKDDENVLYAKKRSPSSLVDRILFLYNHPEIGDKIRENNIEYIKSIGDENINFQLVVDRIKMII